MNRRFFAAALSTALAASLTLPVGALSVTDARSLLEKHYVDTLPPAVYEADSLDGLITALGDPYTIYYTQEEYDSFLTSVNGEEVCGIGVGLRAIYEDGYELLSILPNSPASEAGLTAGEKIIAVDGIVLTPDTPPADLVGGQAGTNVTITLRAPDGTVRDVTLTRRLVQVPIVTYEQNGSAGLILCDSFGDSTSATVRRAVSELDQNSAVWVMDLRNNPGGTSAAAAGAAGVFLGQKVMVFFRDSNGSYYQTATTALARDATDKPLIILTARQSASASELFSAAIRDHSGGIAIGERTYGKGVAQKIYDKVTYPDFFTDDALKITTHRFFSPDGATNHLLGVIPTLLMDAEYAQTAALLLSAPQPERTLGSWKLKLCRQTFYFDNALCLANPDALTALLEALPSSARIYCGIGDDNWLESSPARMAEHFQLSDYTPRTFPDVVGHHYERQINTLRTYDLLHGDEDGLFHPEHTLTRGELAAMLATALNLSPAEGSFSDVSENDWYADAVHAVAARGFMTGTGDGKFSPEATVTNQELYTAYSVLAAWASMDGYDWSLKDVSAVQWARFYEYPEWAQSHIRNLEQLGLSVDPEHPNTLVTRGDAAGLLCDLLESMHVLWNE